MHETLKKVKKHIMDNCGEYRDNSKPWDDNNNWKPDSVGAHSIVGEINSFLPFRNFKVIHFVRTPKRSWGKGFTLKEAAKNAEINLASLKDCMVTLVVFDGHLNEEEFKNQYNCFTVNDVGSICYYDHPEEHDWQERDKYFIGYVEVLI